MPNWSTAGILVGLAALAAITVHYAERSLLPFVETIRTVLYGEQTYNSAQQGCSSLNQRRSWVHPTSLSLTVYGDTQRILRNAFGSHGTEVLPDYAEEFAGVGELLCVADFLLTASEVEEIDGRRVRRIVFDIPQNTYGLANGWVSGLAQGMTGQVLLAAYVETHEAKYLRAARELRNLFFVPVDKGGVRVELSPKSVWYEEYAQPGIRPPLVLNGHLLALDFLYWMYQADPDGETKALFDSGVRAAVEMIDRFSGWGWSYYDQRLNLATGKYHAFHVRQLQRYEMHDDSGALTAARETMQWQLIVPLGVFQRLFTQPSRLLVFLTSMCFIFYVLLFGIVRWGIRSARQSEVADGLPHGEGTEIIELLPGLKSDTPLGIKMLVAQVTSVHPADDVRIYVKQSRTLAEAGYRVALVAPDGRLPSDGSAIQIVLVKRREARLARMIATTWDVFQRTRALRAKIVHFHDPELIPAGLLLKALGRRVIYDVHENVPDHVLSKDWLPRSLRGVVAKVIDLTERVSARLFDAVVAATPDIARRFPAHKTVIVKNFPLLSEFAGREYLIPGRIRRDLVYVGNIADVRGIIEMVEAMAILKQERPGMCLNVAGRFPSVSLEERVRAMDGATVARFLGWQSREQVSNLLSSALAGLVVLHPTPSYQRAYPVKLFEYMAAGIPVIASDFPLWRQIVEEAECGLLVDPHDPRAIADAAIWLCEHENEALAMGAAGAAAVRSRFNWSHEAEKLLRLYARLASS